MFSKRIQDLIRQRLGQVEALHHGGADSLIGATSQLEIPPSEVIRAVILCHDEDYLMAVLPLDHLIDFARLEQQLGRSYRPVPVDRASRFFPDCEAGSIPPLASLYQFPVIIAQQLQERPTLYLEPGDKQTLLKLSWHDFTQLENNIALLNFSRPAQSLISHNLDDFIVPEGLESSYQISALHPPVDIRQEVQQLHKLPALPKMAQRLLKLRNDPKATIEQLVEIVETDPTLAAQVMRYACSVFYGYRGKVESLKDAITRVLGFDMVLNMALGFATSRTVKLPNDGPLGLYSFWCHSLYSASLMQAINNRLPAKERMTPGIAYLAGLLHNIGHILLADKFKAEFHLLNRLVEANPTVQLTLIERRLLGIDHMELGALLLKHWQLPASVVAATQEHHNENYQGEHQKVVTMLQIVEQVLAGLNASKAPAKIIAELPEKQCTLLGLEAAPLKHALDFFIQSQEGMQSMAREMFKSPLGVSR